uniref:Phosphoglycerate kinase n=1 Tax=Ixodes ricinus TaxID=34613 RepID=A0A0K8RB10_IXORI
MTFMLSSKLGLADIIDKLPGARIVLRVDYNVPIKDGRITDSTRIDATIPTIKFLLENNVRSIVLMSHLGRPNGVRDPKYTLSPVADALSKALDNRKIEFMDDCVGEKVEEFCKAPAEGTVRLNWRT